MYKTTYLIVLAQYYTVDAVDIDDCEILRDSVSIKKIVQYLKMWEIQLESKDNDLKRFRAWTSLKEMQKHFSQPVRT